MDNGKRNREGLQDFHHRHGEAFRERGFEQLCECFRTPVHVQLPPDPLIDWLQGVQDPDKLNDDTTYQQCFACGRRNDSGLQLTFRREGDRILAEYLPHERFQGFPGVLHGGVLATMLDETLSRTGAMRQEWLMTGKLEVRYRRPAPVDKPLRIWGEIVRERKGAIDAVGAVEFLDGTIVAEGRGMFLRLPERVASASVAEYPEFINYWQT
jgi:acyl-coenzyme A thioesterase PaaI-like protein